MTMRLTLKVGYKRYFAERLWSIFGVEGAYEKAMFEKIKRRNSLRGLDFGGKPTVLDVIYILEKIWKSPIEWETDIVKLVGGGSNVLMKATILSKTNCSVMSNIMHKIQ